MMTWFQHFCGESSFNRYDTRIIRRLDTQYGKPRQYFTRKEHGTVGVVLLVLTVAAVQNRARPRNARNININSS